MEELVHDLLPGATLQTSGRGDALLLPLTVLVGGAVVGVVGPGLSHGPEVGTTDRRHQSGLTGLGTVAGLRAGLACRGQSR